MKSRARQSGVTMVVTLVLLIVMLLGGMGMARMTEIGALAAGNSAYREGAVHASEVGINTAFAQVRALADEEVDTGNWYWALAQTQDANGLPNVAWTSAPTITVGNYTVRYVVERVCQGALPISDPVRQCLNRTTARIESRDLTREPPDPPSARQFRVTVRVTGPKDSQTFVQALVTRG
jgi:type IV pilus assembly protein PilX